MANLKRSEAKSISASLSASLLSLSLLSFALFLLIYLDITLNGPISALDSRISLGIAFFRTPFLTAMMESITYIGNALPMMILSAILAAVLAVKKIRHDLAFAVMVLGGAYILKSLVKYLAVRPRPDGGLIAASESSFPSGHALMTLVFFAIIIYLFKDRIKEGAKRAIFIILCIIIPLTVGLSRIYLNVHWASDVISGFFLGLAWVSIMIFSHKTMIIKNVMSNSEFWLNKKD